MTQGKIFFPGDPLVDVVVDGALLLFIVKAKPDLLVRITWVNIFHEGRWARREKIIGANKINTGCIVCGIGLEE